MGAQTAADAAQTTTEAIGDVAADGAIEIPAGDLGDTSDFADVGDLLDVDVDVSDIMSDTISMELPILLGVGFLLLIVALAFLIGKNPALRGFAVATVFGASTLGVVGATMYNNAMSVDPATSVFESGSILEGADVGAVSNTPWIIMFVSAGFLAFVGIIMLAVACKKKV